MLDRSHQEPAAIAIRSATAADLSRLLALEHVAFVTDRLTPRAFRHLLTRAQADCLVAGVSSHAGSSGAANDVGGYAAIFYRANARVARLHSLAVDPACQGRGIGAALLAACELAVLARGRAIMRLAARGDNAAAIQLYRSRGYTELGVEQAYYTDGMSALSMEKVLAVA